MNIDKWNSLLTNLHSMGSRENGYKMTVLQWESLNDQYHRYGETDILGCGLKKVWFLGGPDKDRFCWAGCWHDLYYPMDDGFVYHNLPKPVVDLEFRRLCWDIAAFEFSIKLAGRAEVYYDLVQLYQKEFIPIGGF